jgi:PAS domain S-box-containing protein
VWERVVQEGLAGWVIEQKRGTIVSNVAGDERWLVGDQAYGAVQSAVAVPLIQEGRVVGVLTLTDENADHFTGDDLDLLASIGSQAAVAIEKAQLFEAVEQERGRLEAILTGTTDAIVATDEARRVTLVNPAAERAFGVKFADVEGKVLREALPVRELVEAFEQTGESSEPEWAELTLPDGRTLFLNVSAIAGSRGEGGWVAVMQDITYLKELDRMKNEFVSTVSHDLRSPLATIRGYAELLHRRVEGEERDYLECIKTNAEQMGELVGELLDLGRIEAGVAEARIPCRIEEIIEEAVRGVSLRAEMKQLTLTKSLPSTLKPVTAHPVQLRQVLDNLLSNAIKYTPDGGAVSVRAQERDGGVVVEVQDNGIGIPEEAVPRLFGKFFRVKNPETQPVPGTGLGLAIVKAIVEHHEGHVWVTTTLGEGSTFGFWLPGCADGPRTEGSVEEK